MGEKSMGETDAVPVAVDDMEHFDGCTCDLEFDDDEATSDEDLPMASGGVEATLEVHDNPDELDGCALDFTSGEMTADEELPAAEGGV